MEEADTPAPNLPSLDFTTNSPQLSYTQYSRGYSSYHWTAVVGCAVYQILLEPSRFLWLSTGSNGISYNPIFGSIMAGFTVYGGHRM